MLTRILEVEAMDTVEEAHDYDTMDHQAVNRVFVMDFLAVWDGRHPVLDVGTGTAQIPIELCRQHSSVRVTALDLAEQMLRIGVSNVQQAGFAERIHLTRQDAKRLPYASGSFGAVISNSIVHHIPEPSTVLAEMVRVVAPGGLLFVRDLLRPDSDADLQRLVELHAAGANAHQRQLFSDSLHAALTLDEMRERVSALGIDTATVRQTTDRHWTWQARLPE